MATNAAGAPTVASLCTIKSDVCVGLGSEEVVEKTKPGQKISGKCVRQLHQCLWRWPYFCSPVIQVKRFALLKYPLWKAPYTALDKITLYTLFLCMGFVCKKLEIVIEFILIRCQRKTSREHGIEHGRITIGWGVRLSLVYHPLYLLSFPVQTDTRGAVAHVSKNPRVSEARCEHELFSSLSGSGFFVSPSLIKMMSSGFDPRIRDLRRYGNIW